MKKIVAVSAVAVAVLAPNLTWARSRVAGDVILFDAGEIVKVPLRSGKVTTGLFLKQ